MSRHVDSPAITVTHLMLDAPALAASLTRRCHDAGLPVSSEHAIRLTRALVISRPITRQRLYCTARPVLVCDPGQVAVFDRVFATVFGSERGVASDVPPGAVDQTVATSDDGVPPAADLDRSDDGLLAQGSGGRRRLGEDSSTPSDGDERELPVPVIASAQERLRERHFDSLDAGSSHS